MGANKKIAIVGGGISGLTVALELILTNEFEIIVYEQNEILGGKARSLRLEDGNPGEHSMRIFVAGYGSIFQTMQEIPFAEGTTYDNLKYGFFRFSYGSNEFTVNSKYISFPRKIVNTYRLLRFFYRSGISIYELMIFIVKCGRLIWLSPARIQDKLSTISFERYLRGEKRSKAFREIIFSIPEILVAAKSTASAAIIARVLLEWFVGPFLKSDFDRKGFASLDGPTSERFVDPLVSHLRSLGVKFMIKSKVVKLLEKNGAIAGLALQDGTTINADSYVVAVQHNILDALLTPRLRTLLPSLANLEPLREEWSFGAQYYLKKIPEPWQKYVGHITLPIESPWSMAFMIHTNDSIWRGVPLPENTVGVLSLAFSNVQRNGLLHTKPFNKCTRQELLEECLVQIGLNDHPDAIDYGYIGPDLEYLSNDEFDAQRDLYKGYAISHIVESEQTLLTDSLLYVRDPSARKLEPENATDIENLFVAGEFTKTNYGLPTMEKSSESGKRCAAAILSHYGKSYDFDRIKPTQLPFEFLRSIDNFLYRFGLGVEVVFVAFITLMIIFLVTAIG